QDFQQCRLVQGHRVLCPSARTIAVVSLTITRWPLRCASGTPSGPATYTTGGDAASVAQVKTTNTAEYVALQAGDHRCLSCRVSAKRTRRWPSPVGQPQHALACIVNTRSSGSLPGKAGRLSASCLSVSSRIGETRYRASSSALTALDR